MVFRKHNPHDGSSITAMHHSMSQTCLAVLMATTIGSTKRVSLETSVMMTEMDMERRETPPKSAAEPRIANVPGSIQLKRAWYVVAAEAVAG